MLKSKKLLVALLLPVLVLALSLAVFAYNEEDFIIVDGQHFTPEEWAAKQAYLQETVLANPYGTSVDKDFYIPVEDEGFAKVGEGYEGKPFAPRDVMASPATNLVFLDFEDALWPPTGWTHTGNAGANTWEISTSTTIAPYEGDEFCLIAYDAAVTQDEWLTSPVMDLTTGGASWKLDFAWTTGYVWMVNPNDNAEMVVRVTTDGGTSWDSLWCEDDEGVFNDYIEEGQYWAIKSLDLSAYLTETNVQVAFNYYGFDADAFCLDYISVNDGVLPDGRCCYGDPLVPNCADEQQSACEARTDFLSWSGALDCTTPCPVAGANDDCTNPEAITLGTPFSGSTVGATIDCPGVLDWYGVWYSFTLTDACSNVSVSYCGSAGASPSTVSATLIDDSYGDCCDTNSFIYYTTGAFDCPNGWPQLGFANVPAGDYLYCVNLGAEMDFTCVIDAEVCPDAPDNDLCANAEVITGPYPATIAGSTVGATVDCPGVLDWNAVWYVFDVVSSTGCSNVTIDYCATTPDLVTVGVVLFEDCSCGAYILHTNTVWDACGNTNPTSEWKNLPDGTYYYPAFTGPGTYGGVEQDFIMNIDIQECPPPEPGDNCLDPLPVVITGPGFGVYTDNNYTCGRGNAESSTCLSSYDGGEDIFYAIVVTAQVELKFTLDPQGTTYTGMALGSDCPPAGTYYTSCLAEAHGYSSSPKGFTYDCAPGTYYLMIDTWPAPDCIPAFTLIIEEPPPPTPGDNCSDPLKVNLPADAPYFDNNFTCGRGNAESNTCLSYYDGGEDIFYEINVDVAGYYEFIHDPKGTTWTGMGLGASCPPAGSTYSDCIAEATDYSSSPHGFMVYLPVGTYYLQIDTWPSPDCIPDFDLTINFLNPPFLTWDQTMIEFCGVNPDETGCTTLNLGNTGDIDLDYAIGIQYGIPATKEIDGANIVCLDEYTPGVAADFLFTVTNASSDAEWIDSIAITFPAGVTVNTSSDFVVISGGGTSLLYDGTTGANTTVSWGNWNGGYGNIYSTAYAEATINLTFDAGLTGPITLDYHISGDDYGSDPHDIWSTMTIEEGAPYDPYTSWLTVDIDEGTVPGLGNQPIQVCYNSLDIDPGVYFASLVITHNGGLSPITIPVTLNVGPDHDPAAILMIDKSGSMALEDAFGEARFDRAKALAHQDAITLLTGGSMVAVMSVNGSEGIVMVQDFTTNSTEVHDAIDAVVLPRHDTPLAAAMCQAHCTLNQLGCGVDALYTYTDGEENMSLDYDMCYICDLCYQYHASGWNYDCDPSNPASCTDWQLCLADVFSSNGMNVVNYFGAPINPFGKGAGATEDLFFLKFTAETSGGEFNYYADAAYVPGDANSDGTVNVSDAVFIINYVFVAGDAPQPLESGNVNCDESVNVSDAVWLINFVFTGGPAPGDCE